jgi:hypothetical protein
VKFRVAIGTKGYEIAFFVVSQIASGLDVMHLEIFHAATMLATPAVAGEYFAPESPVRFRVKPQSKTFPVPMAHEAIDIRSRSSAFIRSGRNSISRHTDMNNALGSPSTRCAPARKSAQIISRQ